MPIDPRTNTGDPNAGDTNADHSRRSTTEKAGQLAGDLAEQARDQAMQGISKAGDEAERRANQGVDYGVDQVASTAGALRHASDEVGGTLQGQLLRQAADGLTEISNGLRGKTISDIAGDLSTFGRRNPAAFLGGAALAGFAIARFARASQSHRAGHDPDDGHALARAGGSPGGVVPPAPTQTTRPASRPTPGPATDRATSPGQSPYDAGPAPRPASDTTARRDMTSPSTPSGRDADKRSEEGKKDV